jgi:hypothetical protein
MAVAHALPLLAQLELSNIIYNNYLLSSGHETNYKGGLQHKKCKYFGTLYFVDWVLNDDTYRTWTLMHTAVAQVKYTEQTDNYSSWITTTGKNENFPI